MRRGARADPGAEVARYTQATSITEKIAEEINIPNEPRDYKKLAKALCFVLFCFVLFMIKTYIGESAQAGAVFAAEAGRQKVEAPLLKLNSISAKDRRSCSCVL